MLKSKPQSKQAPFCTTISIKHFTLFQHQSTYLKQLSKIKKSTKTRGLSTPSYKELTSSEQK
jgi:hypothetical protein